MALDPLQPTSPSPRRIVVKLGTNVIMRPDGRVALGLLCGLVESIAALHQLGHQVLVVSSGSIGLGMERLGLTTRPTDLAQIQACAATGQSRLMSIYEDAFDRLGCRTAQVLLTEDDFRSPTRHANLARTLNALLALGVIPVINENDTVSVAELDTDPPEPTGSAPQESVISAEPLPTEPSPESVIATEAKRSGETCINPATTPTTPAQSRVLPTEAFVNPVISTGASTNPVISTEGVAQQSRSGETCITPATSTPAPVTPTHNQNQQLRPKEKLFGDNDKLSALVATHIAADLLILLSDVDGLYDRAPTDPAAQLLPLIPAITAEILALAHGGNGRGRGGMLSKLEAARIAQTAGLTVVIANGRSPQVLEQILTNHPTTGTRFPALKLQPEQQS